MASFGPSLRSRSFEILDVANVRLRLKNRCGLGLNQNLPFLDRHVVVSKKASLALGRRSRCLAVLDVARATPPGAKAPAALSKNQIYPLATDTLFPESQRNVRDRWHLSPQTCPRQAETGSSSESSILGSQAASSFNLWKSVLTCVA